MLIPRPRGDENKENYLKRCLSDVGLKGVYPDEEKLREALLQTWENREESVDIDEMKNRIGERESRNIVFQELRVVRSENEPPRIQGHAAVFNEIVDIGSWMREQILPGAFKPALKKSDTRALFNHDENYVLGRNKSKTLEMKEDKDGLAVDILPPETQLIRDLVLTPMERGDINQMSFGFSVKKEQWDEEKGKTPLRSIVEIENLYDVSVVTFPAYPTTDASVRSILTRAGIDFEAVSCMIARAKRGFELKSSDLDLIKATIEVLNGYLPAPLDGAKGGKDGTDDDAARKLTLFRKRLELATKL